MWKIFFFKTLFKSINLHFLVYIPKIVSDRLTLYQFAKWHLNDQLYNVNPNLWIGNYKCWLILCLNIFIFKPYKKLNFSSDYKRISHRKLNFISLILYSVHDDIENELLFSPDMRKIHFKQSKYFSPLAQHGRVQAEGMMGRLLDYMIWIKPWSRVILQWLNLPGMSLQVVAFGGKVIETNWTH